jgi:small acid-soluble spore protein D (minor alpha/beta-type SASP)
MENCMPLAKSGFSWGRMIQSSKGYTTLEVKTMSRRRSRSLVVPEAGESLDLFKVQVMRQQGYAVDINNPNQVKYEVARSMGIPLTEGDNGQLTTEAAGRVGGEIGGAMVREMVRMAKEQLVRNSQ